MSEAAISSVPVVGLAFAWDQPRNVAQAEAMGIGCALDVRALTADQVVRAARRMLDDAEYPERAARIRAEMLARDTGAAGAAGLLERAARLRLDEAAERDGWACLSASSAAGGTEAHHPPPVLGEPSSDGTLIWKVLGEPSSDGEAESQAGWADDLD